MVVLLPVAVLAWHVLVLGLALLAGQVVFFLSSFLGLRFARFSFSLSWLVLVLPLGLAGSMLVHLPVLCEKLLEFCGLSPGLSVVIVAGLAITVVAPQIALPLGVGFELAAEGWSNTPLEIDENDREYYIAKGRCLRWGLGSLLLTILGCHALLLTVFSGLLDSWELFLRG